MWIGRERALAGHSLCDTQEFFDRSQWWRYKFVENKVKPQQHQTLACYLAEQMHQVRKYTCTYCSHHIEFGWHFQFSHLPFTNALTYKRASELCGVVCVFSHSSISSHFPTATYPGTGTDIEIQNILSGKRVQWAKRAKKNRFTRDRWGGDHFNKYAPMYRLHTQCKGSTRCYAAPLSNSQMANRSMRIFWWRCRVWIGFCCSLFIRSLVESCHRHAIISYVLQRTSEAIIIINNDRAGAHTVSHVFCSCTLYFVHFVPCTCSI